MMTATRGDDTAGSENALSGWTVVSLRPAGGHDSLRRAARRKGATLLPCSPLRLVACADHRDTLRDALAAPRVVFTSPAAARFAAGRMRLHPAPAAHWYAVGEGTARALARAGVAAVTTPGRMDSEGLLDLPGLHDVAGVRVGLVTAPGGRGVIAQTLSGRGAEVMRADVYRREPMRLGHRCGEALAALDISRTALLLTSGEAFEAFRSQLPAALDRRLRDALVVASSPRLADKARADGFERIVTAHSARPAALMAALTAYAATGTFG